MQPLRFERRHTLSALLFACATGCGASDQSAADASGGATGSGGLASGASGGVRATGGAQSGGRAGDSASGGRVEVPSGGASTGEVDCLHDADARTTLGFVNRCARPITFAGSDIRGKTLAQGEFSCVDVGNASDAISSKRYWGYFDADPGPGKYSLAEFTFNTDFQDFDWYNISYVDAFNVPMQITPVARPKCKALTCAADFLSACPTSGRYENGSGELVACVNPSRDDGANPVAAYFESCDEAYAWSGDDQNGTDPSPVRACAGEDFDIVFCPEPAK